MITIQVGGLEATLIQLQHSKVSVRDAAGPAFMAAGKALRTAIRKRISLRDHTLKDLARKDHPYARRHGTIQIHRRMPWQVHTQSGRALNALQGRPITVNGQHEYEVTFDYGLARHMEHVILGTKVMLPRDVLWKTAQDPSTQTEMMRRIVAVLGKRLRSQLGVRFRSVSPRATVGAGGGAVAVT